MASSVFLYPGTFTVAGNLVVAGNATPATDNTFDLGSSSLRWRTGYFGTSVNIGTNPAASGFLRIPNGNGTVGISARNFANDGDRVMLWLDSSNSTNIGEANSSVVIATKITNYNSITTSGLGVPVVVATGRFTAQVAAKASVSAFTVGGSDGSFEVSANVNVTASTAHTFTTTVTYTDETNASRTLTFGFTQLSGATLITAITNVTGVGPYESPVYHIRCKAATTITVATTGTFTTVTYNVEGIIKQTA